MTVLRTEEVLALRRSLSRVYGPARSALLRTALGRPIRSAKALREWHDLLLFLLAHPADAEEHTFATAELERVVGMANDRAWRSERERYALINTGIAGMPLQSTFTLRITRWMLARWGDRVELFSVEAPLDEFVELLRMVLPQCEWETVDQPANDVYELLDRTYGPSHHAQLLRLVQGVNALRVDERTREYLWARMQVYVKVEGASGCGMSHARAPIDKPFTLQDGLQRHVDVMAVVDEPVSAPLRLSAPQQAELIATARTVLATLHRETDPVTCAGAVELFDLGRGLRIALFHLVVEHRLPFDSYVGFMAFRNGVPLAYGGAWIFPGRSKVGINVFPALRGGESAWFFAQLLRLYRQRFGVDRFEAENYQLGHGNADGLKSGAYWFYYRLGFRPTTKALQRTAEREFKKLSARKGYQVPMTLLKELVEQGLELVITERGTPLMDTAALTMAVQRHVVERYGGDRQQAMRSALERLGKALPLGDLADWSPDERAMLYLCALPLDMVADLENWSTVERKRLVVLVRSKAAVTETAHQAALARHQRLLRAWQQLAAV
jgi:hypothetical protein